MRITCPDCQKTTVITHRVPLTEHIFDIYCTCRHCGSRTVFNLAFKHHVEPASAASVVATLLLSLTPSDRALVVEQAGLLPPKTQA